ncbi:unnamed protein product, partial [Closterium sp. NIES-54]
QPTAAVQSQSHSQWIDVAETVSAVPSQSPDVGGASCPAEELEAARADAENADIGIQEPEAEEAKEAEEAEGDRGVSGGEREPHDAGNAGDAGYKEDFRDGVEEREWMNATSVEIEGGQLGDAGGRDDDADEEHAVVDREGAQSDHQEGAAEGEVEEGEAEGEEQADKEGEEEGEERGEGDGEEAGEEGEEREEDLLAIPTDDIAGPIDLLDRVDCVDPADSVRSDSVHHVDRVDRVDRVDCVDPMDGMGCLDGLETRCLADFEDMLPAGDALDMLSVRRAGESVRRAGESVRRAGESVRRAGESVRRAGESVRRAGENVRRAGVSLRHVGVSVCHAGVSVRREEANEKLPSAREIACFFCVHNPPSSPLPRASSPCFYQHSRLLPLRPLSPLPLPRWATIACWRWARVSFRTTSPLLSFSRLPLTPTSPPPLPLRHLLPFRAQGDDCLLALGAGLFADDLASFLPMPPHHPSSHAKPSSAAGASAPSARAPPHAASVAGKTRRAPHSNAAGLRRNAKGGSYGSGNNNGKSDGKTGGGSMAISVARKDLMCDQDGYSGSPISTLAPLHSSYSLPSPSSPRSPPSRSPRSPSARAPSASPSARPPSPSPLDRLLLSPIPGKRPRSHRPFARGRTWTVDLLNDLLHPTEETYAPEHETDEQWLSGQEQQRRQQWRRRQEQEEQEEEDDEGEEGQEWEQQEHSRVRAYNGYFRASKQYGASAQSGRNRKHKKAQTEQRSRQKGKGRPPYTGRPRGRPSKAAIAARLAAAAAAAEAEAAVAAGGGKAAAGAAAGGAGFAASYIVPILSSPLHRNSPAAAGATAGGTAGGAAGAAAAEASGRLNAIKSHKPSPLSRLSVSSSDRSASTVSYGPDFFSGQVESVFQLPESAVAANGVVKTAAGRDSGPDGVPCGSLSSGLPSLSGASSLAGEIGTGGNMATAPISSAAAKGPATPSDSTDATADDTSLAAAAAAAAAATGDSAANANANAAAAAAASNGAAGGVVRRCLHCSVTKTPQWRAGPYGPKTLCNACGVRYKSGRLCAEYRPANSPEYVAEKHSNSHRRIVEMRRSVIATWQQLRRVGDGGEEEGEEGEGMGGEVGEEGTVRAEERMNGRVREVKVERGDACVGYKKGGGRRRKRVVEEEEEEEGREWDDEEDEGEEEGEEEEMEEEWEEREERRERGEEWKGPKRLQRLGKAQGQEQRFGGGRGGRRRLGQAGEQGAGQRVGQVEGKGEGERVREGREHGQEQLRTDLSASGKGRKFAGSNQAGLKQARVVNAGERAGEGEGEWAGEAEAEEEGGRKGNARRLGKQLERGEGMQGQKGGWRSGEKGEGEGVVGKGKEGKGKEETNKEGKGKV